MYKILMFGDYISQIHEIPLGDSISKKGHAVRHFKVSSFYKFKFLKNFYNLQIKLRFGPLVWKVNKELLKEVELNNYDLVFLYRPVILKPTILEKVKRHSLLFCYNNDDPFGERYSNFFWKDYINGLMFCDHIFYYRIKNYYDYKSRGYSNISILRSFYNKLINYPIDNLDNRVYSCDVCFIGHYESDGRDLILKSLIDSGVNLKIYGPDWVRSPYYNYLCSKLGYKIKPLNSNDYNLTLNSSKIALVFLSKLNNDTYTRRCFEIPATKTFMLSQYSEDLNTLFKDGKEAVYFNSYIDLKQKIGYYLSHDKERKLIAEAGYSKLIADGHEASDRADDVINKITLLLNEK